MSENRSHVGAIAETHDPDQSSEVSPRPGKGLLVTFEEGTVWVGLDGEDLALRAPRTVLCAEVLTALRAMKPALLQILRTDQPTTGMASQKIQNPHNSAQVAQETVCAYCGTRTGWEGTLCPACLAEAEREVARVRLERTPRPSAEMASQNTQNSAGVPSLTAADRTRLGLDQLAPCRGRCGAITPHGWYCMHCVDGLVELEVGHGAPPA